MDLRNTKTLANIQTIGMISGAAYSLIKTTELTSKENLLLSKHFLVIKLCSEGFRRTAASTLLYL